MKKENKQDWEKEFDKKFVHKLHSYMFGHLVEPKQVKIFIKKQLTKAREEAYKEVIKDIKCSYPKALTTTEHNNNIAVIDNAVLEIKQYLSEKYLKSLEGKK